MRLTPDATSPCSHAPVRVNQTDTTATIIFHDTTLSRTPKREASPPPIETPCSPHSFTLAATNRNTISTEKRQRRKRTQATTATDQGMGLNPWPQHPIYTPPSTIPQNRVNRGKNTTQDRKKPHPITQSRPRPPIEIAEDLAPNTPPGNRPLRPPQNKNLATIMITGKPTTHCIPLSSSPEQVNPTIRLTTHYRALTPLINRNKNHKP